MRFPPPPLPVVRSVGLMQPLAWLALGWRDMARAGSISFAHGLAITLVGAAIVAVAYNRFWLLAGALSGFLVVAPVLATSLYALSRALEQREPADTAVVLKTWLNWQHSHVHKWGNDYWCMVQFGALLALAATGWVVTSAALITLLAPVPIETPRDFLLHVVLADEGWLPVLQWTSRAPGTRFPPGECIHRGKVGMRRGDAPPDETLRPGVRYGVNITGDIANPGRGDATVLRRYSAEFCLREDGPTWQIMLVPRIRGELDWSVCETPAANGQSAARK